MANILLGTLELPEDLEWINEFADGSDLVGQSVSYTVTGAQIIQASAKQAGRSIVLQGRMEGDKGFAPITLTTLNALRALAATAGTEYTLVLADGRSFQVVFNREGGAAVTAESFKHIVPRLDEDFYFPTIRFLQV